MISNVFSKWYNINMNFSKLVFVFALAALAGCSGLPRNSLPEGAAISSTPRIRVTPQNGVWDDEYASTSDERGCSFEFSLSRYSDGIVVSAVVFDDKLVTDDCRPGAVSCPSWDDDNLEVFFDGNYDKSLDARAGDGLKYGGEFTLVANGAAQSDFSGLPKSFGRAWRGNVRPERQADGSWRIYYDLFFTWACLGRTHAPADDEDLAFGFNICIHDDDDGGRNDYALYWKGNPARPYRDESKFGDIVLKGRKCK